MMTHASVVAEHWCLLKKYRSGGVSPLGELCQIVRITDRQDNMINRHAAYPARAERHSQLRLVFHKGFRRPGCRKIVIRVKSMAH